MTHRAGRRHDLRLSIAAMRNTKTLVGSALLILLFTGCWVGEGQSEVLAPDPAPSVNAAPTPDASAAVAREDLDADLQTLVEDFDTVHPIFEAYASKDNASRDGDAPFNVEGMLDISSME